MRNDANQQRESPRRLLSSPTAATADAPAQDEDVRATASPTIMAEGTPTHPAGPHGQSSTAAVRSASAARTDATVEFLVPSPGDVGLSPELDGLETGNSAMYQEDFSHGHRDRHSRSVDNGAPRGSPLPPPSRTKQLSRVSSSHDAYAVGAHADLHSMNSNTESASATAYSTAVSSPTATCEYGNSITSVSAVSTASKADASPLMRGKDYTHRSTSGAGSPAGAMPFSFNGADQYKPYLAGGGSRGHHFGAAGVAVSRRPRRDSAGSRSVDAQSTGGSRPIGGTTEPSTAVSSLNCSPSNTAPTSGTDKRTFLFPRVMSSTKLGHSPPVAPSAAADSGSAEPPASRQMMAVVTSSPTAGRGRFSTGTMPRGPTGDSSSGDDEDGVGWVRTSLRSQASEGTAGAIPAAAAAAGAGVSPAEQPRQPEEELPAVGAHPSAFALMTPSAVDSSNSHSTADGATMTTTMTAEGSTERTLPAAHSLLSPQEGGPQAVGAARVDPTDESSPASRRHTPSAAGWTGLTACSMPVLSVSTALANEDAVSSPLLLPCHAAAAARRQLQQQQQQRASDDSHVLSRPPSSTAEQQQQQQLRRSITRSSVPDGRTGSISFANPSMNMSFNNLSFLKDPLAASVMMQQNRTALIAELERRRAKLRRQLSQLQREAMARSIFAMVRASNASQLQHLLQEKLCNVNERDYNGCTALHVAAGEGNQAIVRVLLSFGADVLAVDKFGRTALDCAVANRHSGVGRYLLGIIRGGIQQDSTSRDATLTESSSLGSQWVGLGGTSSNGNAAADRAGSASSSSPASQALRPRSEVSLPSPPLTHTDTPSSVTATTAATTAATAQRQPLGLPPTPIHTASSSSPSAMLTPLRSRPVPPSSAGGSGHTSPMLSLNANVASGCSPSTEPPTGSVGDAMDKAAQPIAAAQPPAHNPLAASPLTTAASRPTMLRPQRLDCAGSPPQENSSMASASRLGDSGVGGAGLSFFQRSSENASGVSGSNVSASFADVGARTFDDYCRDAAVLRTQGPVATWQPVAPVHLPPPPPVPSTTTAAAAATAGDDAAQAQSHGAAAQAPRNYVLNPWCSACGQSHPPMGPCPATQSTFYSSGGLDPLSQSMRREEGTPLRGSSGHGGTPVTPALPAVAATASAQLPILLGEHAAHNDGSTDAADAADAADTHQQHFSSYSTISDTVSLVVCMCGLPGRGKSFISKRLVRYMNWKGVPCSVFNAGAYRRQLLGVEGTANADFFNPDNPAGKELREQMADLACQDLMKFISEHQLAVGVLDATNTTKKRRLHLKEFFAEEAKKRGIAVRLLFIESVCTDETIITENILRSKCDNDDFKMVKDTKAVIAEFRDRIVQYERVYETLESSEDLPYIKIINVKHHVVIHKVHTGLGSRIAFFLLNLHPVAYPIYIALPGETRGSAAHMFGGDDRLTVRGQAYAIALKRFIQERYVPNMVVLHATNRSVLSTLRPLIDDGGYDSTTPAAIVTAADGANSTVASPSASSPVSDGPMRRRSPTSRLLGDHVHFVRSHLHAGKHRHIVSPTTALEQPLRPVTVAAESDEQLRQLRAMAGGDLQDIPLDSPSAAAGTATPSPAPEPPSGRTQRNGKDADDGGDGQQQQQQQRTKEPAKDGDAPAIPIASPASSCSAQELTSNGAADNDEDDAMEEVLCPVPGLDQINYGRFSECTAEWIASKYPRLSSLLYVDASEEGRVAAAHAANSAGHGSSADGHTETAAELLARQPPLPIHFTSVTDALPCFAHAPSGSDPLLSYCVQFPNGESCRQVNVRLEPALMAVMRTQSPVFVVAPAVPAQGTLAFFTDVIPELSPTLRLPQHCVVEIGVKNDITVHRLLADAGDDRLPGVASPVLDRQEIEDTLRMAVSMRSFANPLASDGGAQLQDTAPAEPGAAGSAQLV